MKKAAVFGNKKKDDIAQSPTTCKVISKAVNGQISAQEIDRQNVQSPTSSKRNSEAEKGQNSIQAFERQAAYPKNAPGKTPMQGETCLDKYNDRLPHCDQAYSSSENFNEDGRRSGGVENYSSDDTMDHGEGIGQSNQSNPAQVEDDRKLSEGDQPFEKVISRAAKKKAKQKGNSQVVCGPIAQDKWKKDGRSGRLIQRQSEVIDRVSS